MWPEILLCGSVACTKWKEVIKSIFFTHKTAKFLMSFVFSLVVETADGLSGFVISGVTCKFWILAGFKLERTWGWLKLNFCCVFSLHALVLPVTGHGGSASLRLGLSQAASSVSVFCDAVVIQEEWENRRCPISQMPVKRLDDFTEL